MRILTLALAIFSIAVFNGCASGVDNDFIVSTPGGYASTCETFFSDYPIGVEKLYELKLSILFNFKNSTCGDKWCKIYYPCDETEYFVKKDDIVKRKY